MPRLLEVFLRFLRLGFTAFGGPIAHLGYFEREFVERAKWLERNAFAEMVALCTALPGPTSSQVGMLLGATRAGPLGAVAAWLGFTAPSAIFMGIIGTVARVFAIPGVTTDGDPGGMLSGGGYLRAHSPIGAASLGALASLYFTALAVVIVAVYSLSRSLLTTTFARVIALLAFLVAIVTFAESPGLSWIVLVGGGLLGARLMHAPRAIDSPIGLRVDARIGTAALAILLTGLIVLPLVAHSPEATLFATTFRAGSLVFGGGHVVLAFLTPLIATTHASIPGAFQTGYGIVQAVPGPLFTFASFLGGADADVPYGLGAPIATIGIFMPSFLILPAALSLWSQFRGEPWAGGALAGTNAAVVGLLGATIVYVFEPRLASGFPPLHILTTISALLLLTRWRWPAWGVVLGLALVCALYNELAQVVHAPAFLRLA